MKLAIVALAAASLAASQTESPGLFVHAVQIPVDGGVHPGKLVLFSDQMGIVDDADPNLSAIFGRVNIHEARLQGGTLSMRLRRPASFGAVERREIELRGLDAQSARLFSAWFARVRVGPDRARR
ncbi:MAG: hypothetical protein HYZ57_00640 [Acidobacteria bacterium]|nr:hypothetical protein [Acidobacteriota bacterium]